MKMKPLRKTGLNLGLLAAEGTVLLAGLGLRIGAALSARVVNLLRSGRRRVNRDRDELD